MPSVRFGRPPMSEVMPGLRIGGAPSGREIRALNRAGITRVVDLRAEVEGADDRWPEGVTVVRVPTDDWQGPDAVVLEELSGRITGWLGQGEHVLVHCRAGVGRSAAVVLSVLIRLGYPLAEAHRLLRERRPQIAPSELQMAYVIEFERRRHRGAVIPASP